MLFDLVSFFYAFLSVLVKESVNEKYFIKVKCFMIFDRST